MFLLLYISVDSVDYMNRFPSGILGFSSLFSSEIYSYSENVECDEVLISEEFTESVQLSGIIIFESHRDVSSQIYTQYSRRRHK